MYHIIPAYCRWDFSAGGKTLGAAQSLDSKYYQEEDGWLKMANGHDDDDEDDNSDDEDDEDGDDHDKALGAA